MQVAFARWQLLRRAWRAWPRAHAAACHFRTYHLLSAALRALRVVAAATRRRLERHGDFWRVGVPLLRSWKSWRAFVALRRFRNVRFRTCCVFGIKSLRCKSAAATTCSKLNIACNVCFLNTLGKAPTLPATQALTAILLPYVCVWGLLLLRQALCPHGIGNVCCLTTQIRQLSRRHSLQNRSTCLLPTTAFDHTSTARCVTRPQRLQARKAWVDKVASSLCLATAPALVAGRGSGRHPLSNPDACRTLPLRRHCRAPRAAMLAPRCGGRSRRWWGRAPREQQPGCAN